MATKSQITSIDDEAPQVAEPSVTENKVARPNMSGVYEMVTIHSTDGDGGTEAVPVQINSYLWQIPRDQPTRVPTEVADILRNAKTINLRPSNNGGNTESMRHRFAFSATPA